MTSVPFAGPYSGAPVHGAGIRQRSGQRRRRQSPAHDYLLRQFRLKAETTRSAWWLAFVLPVAALAFGHPLDGGLEAARAGLVGLGVGDPLDVLALCDGLNACLGRCAFLFFLIAASMSAGAFSGGFGALTARGTLIARSFSAAASLTIRTSALFVRQLVDRFEPAPPAPGLRHRVLRQLVISAPFQNPMRQCALNAAMPHIGPL